jgi:iron complex transport system substrate-binding protein
MTAGIRDSGFGIRAVTLVGTLSVLVLLTHGARGLPWPEQGRRQPPGDTTPQSGNAPRRIVSLVPSATEMLFAMGAGPRVAAVGSFDHFPPEVERLPRVGALVDPDVERILSLRPDLVVAYGSQTDLLARLKRASIPVYVYRHGSLADIPSVLRDLGARIGMADGAQSAAVELERGLAEVRTSVAGRRRPRTLLVIGREPQSLRAVNVSGGYGFLHDLLDLAGGQNVFADVRRESMMVATETILATQPEVIIELHYSEHASPDAETRERDAWRLLPGVPAVRSGRVHLLYGGEFVVPGPRVVFTARAFARALHPEARGLKTPGSIAGTPGL